MLCEGLSDADSLNCSINHKSTSKVTRFPEGDALSEDDSEADCEGELDADGDTLGLLLAD